MVLTDRQQSILNCIVIDHIKTANPIASEAIANQHGLGISPATIRNDVAKLEEAGAPHKFLHYKDRGHMFITEDLIKESLKFIAEWSD